MNCRCQPVPTLRNQAPRAVRRSPAWRYEHRSPMTHAVQAAVGEPEHSRYSYSRALTRLLHSQAPGVRKALLRAQRAAARRAQRQRARLAAPGRPCRLQPEE